MYFFYYLPIGISAQIRRFPVMTSVYAAICVVVFASFRYFPGLVPFDLYNLIYVPQGGGVVDSMASAFLHLGYAHLVGNLLYLTFFGRYVEDRMGPVLFTVVFLTSAAIGNYWQGAFNTRFFGDPYTGIIGASGAISGLLGAFTVRFIRSKLVVAYWVFFPLQAYTRAGRAEIPSVLAIGLWFIMQTARGLAQLDGTPAQVAYVSHVAGFAWGGLVAAAFGQYREGSIEAFLERGHRYLRDGKPYAAQGAYISYLTHQPHDAQAYASLARAMILTGTREGASKNYRRACELLIDQGQRGETESVYVEALRGDERFTLSSEYHLNLAFGLERNLKPQVAVKAYENFGRDYPLHNEAAFALLRAAGLYRHTLANVRRARMFYRKIVDAYPEDRWVDFAREQVRQIESRGGSGGGT
ncbi:MAG: rhomboid family intramembrane serine protease [Candidatus Krumholzibacteriia bacterium]